MTIEIVYFDGCPNWKLAEQRVREALKATDHADTEIRLHRVENPVEAERAEMHGSPTILIDGQDPFPKASDAVWSCRLYQTGSGFQGAPSVSALVGALRRP